MMHDVLTIMSKELKRFWIDKKLLFTTVLLPGIMIFLIYSIMGNVIGNQVDEITQSTTALYVENMPEALEPLFDPTLFEVQSYAGEDPETFVNDTEGVILIFEEDFLEKVSSDAFPAITLYYDGSNETSSEGGSRVRNILSSFRNQILAENYTEEERLVFQENITAYQDESEIFATIVSSIVPLLIVIFIFASALSIAPDIIAGEKERGTLATLLVTPISRGSFALGKILAITVISLASAMSSFIGVALSIPVLLQLESTGNVNVLDIYGVGGMVALLLVILSTTLVIVGIMSVVSTYAKSIKEAASLASPLYLITIVISALNLFSDGSSNELLNAIPLYGSIQVINGVLARSYTWTSVGIVVVSSLLTTGLLAWVVKVMLSSERIVFQKWMSGCPLRGC